MKHLNAKVKLTPELQKQITAAIRAGAFPHIAAESFGVPTWLFDHWMAKGLDRKRVIQPFRDFALEIQQAKAQARLRAEMEIFKDDPKTWLKSGPGKEKPEEPGWTGIVKPILAGDQHTVNIFTNPDFLRLMGILRTILGPYPELLARINEAIEKPDKPVPQEKPITFVNQLPIKPSDN